MYQSQASQIVPSMNAPLLSGAEEGMQRSCLPHLCVLPAIRKVLRERHCLCKPSVCLLLLSLLAYIWHSSCSWFRCHMLSVSGSSDRLICCSCGPCSGCRSVGGR